MFLNPLGRFKYLTEIAQYSSLGQVIFNSPKYVKISDLNLFLSTYVCILVYLLIYLFLSLFIPILLFKGLVTRTGVYYIFWGLWDRCNQQYRKKNHYKVSIGVKVMKTPEASSLPDYKGLFSPLFYFILLCFAITV